MVRHLKAYMPIIILVTTYQVAQIYEFWNFGGDKEYNWILFGQDTAMTVAWNIKYISEEVCRVLEGWAILITVRKLISFIRNPTPSEKWFIQNVIVVWQIYFVYRCLDVVYYFINFKREWYNSIWFVLAIIEYFIIKKRKKS